MSKTAFQTLKELPTPLSRLQCVLHKHEILICGGYQQKTCYSYHILKNEYKFICEYPSNVILNGHCVVKLVESDNNNKDSNQITLLSFGGWNIFTQHTLVMKYVSVWSDISNKSNEFNNYNQWVPFKDNRNLPVIIEREQNNYWGARAVIGGSNNHLLFITFQFNNISVFNLNTFQFIKHDTLPTDNFVQFHCFVSSSENGQGQEMKINRERNKQNSQMLLFCDETGLSIEYDEDNNHFQFHELPVCDGIESFCGHVYVCINDVILFFGGKYWDGNRLIASKSVHKYSIRKNKWITFQNILRSPLYECTGILNEEDNHIHIIGGLDDEDTAVSTHIKTKVRTWDPLQLVMICLFINQT
ncbi:hypothetical protein RFI_05523 [Reticulomyxa filosa]|uniref:Kelch motif family protein n=1 Tax=Reticulomyxa filosa TaxID=46433 RepID=X6P020_RETFI|nr:hypothetical protein RFI_05523 [Reticulomyxa filosa]|eukprot:ETO31596.1 hypothetical protein RFI_05523 [Reticulomyxa filosa]